MLPGGLQWGRTGFKYLGFFLGTDDLGNKIGRALWRKCVQGCLAGMVATPAVLQGRVLICNNLVASSLWHKIMILEPPKDLVKGFRSRWWTFSGQGSTG